MKSLLRPPSPGTAAGPVKGWGLCLGIGALVFAASLLGIVTRPVGFMAAFWPANALLLGLLVRYPRLAASGTWAAAAVGYVAADLAAGTPPLATLWLAAANLCGVAMGWWLFGQVPVATRFLKRQMSVVLMFGICVASSAAAALVGSGTGPLLFNTAWPTALGMWFCTELINSVLILPVLLSLPTPQEARRTLKKRRWSRRRWKYGAPLLALAASEAAAIAIGGPGALAFPVPALLWCALTYGVFATSVLSMLTCFGLAMAAGAGVLDLAFAPTHAWSVFSLRVGISLLGLGPLSVATAKAASVEAMRRLHRAASHDFLTDALARRAFMAQGSKLLARLARERSSVAVLMLDLDHFKRVNDTYGHAQGDKVLHGFAATVSDALRPGDLFGRLGGEEFAVVLPRIRQADAMAVARRLCKQVRNHPFALPGHATPLHATVSIGLVVRTGVSAQDSLGALMSDADAALYEAKAAGRDRTHLYEEPRATPGP
ncbi:diguanylate cyclase (GGDEF)-like protein [Acidovorax soli]|jgi:diguanylate cyclase (GGDEF)-like protein|uniref:diguanylate cyclase n=1 Tax=Acidovorax soli TaxID=592050 RepID=A0A7X0UAS3_9BURK|nr:GGDEF domain-containing protein [Acidovorax soli]MBB6561388.1 diguanylate cyclase (GGDEF)-like protein [Acidovorax soli]